MNRIKILIGLNLSICKCSIILNFVLVSLLYIIDSQVLYFTTCIYYFLDSVHRYKKRKTTFIFINIFEIKKKFYAYYASIETKFYAIKQLFVFTPNQFFQFRWKTTISHTKSFKAGVGLCFVIPYFKKDLLLIHK